MPRATLLPLIAATLTFAVFASPAQAGWRVDRATAIARVVWHNPNVDRMQIRWNIPPADTEDASAWTWVDDGIIWLDSRYPLAWEPFCTLVLHEAGHLAGMGHAASGIMSPVATFEHETSNVNGHRLTRWLGTDARCRDNGRPFLRAHGVL